MMRKVNVGLLGCLGILFSANAQTPTYHSNEIWTRLALIKEISPRWETRLDLNYRRQSNFLEHEGNPFHFPQAHLFRVSVAYRTKSNFSVIASPFLYSDNFRLRYVNSQQSTVAVVNQREIRFTLGVQKLLKLSKLQVRPRVMAEYRNFLDTDAQWRSRVQLHFQYPVYKPHESHILSVVAFDEVFHNLTHLDKIVIDQNRSFLGIFYQAGKLFEYQLGYQFTYQKQSAFVLNRSQVLAYVHLRF